MMMFSTLAARGPSKHASDGGRGEGHSLAWPRISFFAQISSRKFDPKAPKSHENLIEIRGQVISEYFMNTLYSHSPNKGYCVHCTLELLRD